MTKIHKTTGWKRTAIGFGRFTITPADDSGSRIVHFMSAGSWQNLPNDDRANIDRDRVVLVDGPELPPWAREWLEKANALSCSRARSTFSAMMEQADSDLWDRKYGGDY